MKHATVPYHGNPTSTFCALACYAMIGQYLLPDAGITFKMFGELADYRAGYVVWGYPVWQWLMDHGIHIHDQDISNKEAWIKEGVNGLKKSVSAKEFEYYQKNTYNLQTVTDQLKLVDNHPNFSYTQKKVTWEDIVQEFEKPGICELTLNGKFLAKKEGFSVHRVVLLGIDIARDEVVFHNPRIDNKGAFQRESIGHFRKAIESLSGPELCRYWKEGT